MKLVGGERERALFLPCVLDRLTDLNPESRTDSFSHAVSVQVLRRSVLENLDLILNSRSRPRYSDLNSKSVRDSVIGLGLEDFCGVTHSRDHREHLRREILRQIKLFEPRLSAESLEVAFASDAAAASGAILEFEIRGMISVAPLSQELVFRARLNLESGAAEMGVIE